MCGACGRSVLTDAWSDVLATRRARWEAARVVNASLVRAGYPSRVGSGTGPWIVQSGTGASVVADTITDLWRHLIATRPFSVDMLRLLDDTQKSEVTRAVFEAALQVLTEREASRKEQA